MDHPLARSRIDALIAGFFSAFDNREGATPRLAAINECFAENGIVVRRGTQGMDVWSVEAFALPRIALLTQGALRDFHERETRADTQVWGSIATRTSRYKKSGALDGRPYAGTGTKCFQLVELPSGWRIVSLIWEDDA